MWVGKGKTGGNTLIDAPIKAPRALAMSHSICDSESRDLDFFLIGDASGYDYILCLAIKAFSVGWHGKFNEHEITNTYFLFEWPLLILVIKNMRHNSQLD